jgi:hypothetical protein
MQPYVVQQGDFLDRLAVRLGFDAQKVWNDPQNASLKKARGNPNILCPGDVLYVPETKKTWLPVAVGGTNTFTVTIPKMTVHLKLVGEGAPLANKSCRVEGSGDPLELTTDGEGSLSFSLPITCEVVSIVFDDPPLRYAVRPGWMDPHEEPSGMHFRLANLGYVDDVGLDGDSMADSLAAFQVENGLEPTGNVDEPTRQKLVDRHGH